MAIISASFISPTDETQITPSSPVVIGSVASYNGPRFGFDQFLNTVYATIPQQIIYRGRLGSDYVYSVGSPPLGATDVVIIAII